MKKTADTKTLFIFSLGDFSRAIFQALTVTYLMYIFLPDESSSIPLLLPFAAIAYSILKGIAVIFDGVIDPWIANRTDKSTNKHGARVSFMRFSVIPMTLFGMFMIFVPIESASWINAVWLILTLLGFNLFSSLYNVPYNALSAELVTDDKRRVFFYTISTLLFVIGSALAFTTPFLKGFLVSSGLSELWAWRVSFIIFGVIGGVAAAIPAFKIKENDYIERKPCFVPLFESFKATFKYKNFTILVIAYLIMWIGFAFFNYSLMYYITILLGLAETFSTIVMVISITVGIASYPLVNILAKKFGKKPLLLCAAVAYIIIYGTISMYNVIVPVIGGEVFAILIGVLIGMPISITNIIPSAAFADMAQYDTIVTGINRAGMFGAARNFMNNLSQSIVAFILPLVISFGSPEGYATEKGTQISAIVPTVMIAFSLIFYVLYNDKEVVGTIKKYNEDLALKVSQGEISEQQ